MLDSPYVRRVAISLHLLELPFTHENLSVFRDYDAFAAINPVVKAPTLVTGDGMVLMDSTLILEHAEQLAGDDRSLMPAALAEHAHCQRILGLALAACEKSVQIVYERMVRPEEKRYPAWIDRVSGQLNAAYRLLEAEIAAGPRGADPWLFGPALSQADITSAVAWRFTREMIPDVVPIEPFPTLAALSARAEETAGFVAYPYS